MRKLGLLMGFAALAVLTVAPVSAGGVGLMASTWDTETAGDDQGGGFKVEIEMGDAFELELRGSLFSGFAQVSEGDLFSIEGVPLDFGLAYNFKQDEEINPYIGLGGTYLSIKPDQGALGLEVDASRPHSQEEFGYYGEVGIEFRASERFSVFIEGLYRQVKGEVRGRNLNTDPNRDFEVDFAGASANIGILFRY